MSLKIKASPFPLQVHSSATLRQVQEALAPQGSVLVSRLALYRARRAVTRALRGQPHYDLTVSAQGKVLRSVEAAMRRTEDIHCAVRACIARSSDPVRTSAQIDKQATACRLRYFRRQRKRFDRNIQSAGDCSDDGHANDAADDPGLRVCGDPSSHADAAAHAAQSRG